MQLTMEQYQKSVARVIDRCLTRCCGRCKMLDGKFDPCKHCLEARIRANKSVASVCAANGSRGNPRDAANDWTLENDPRWRAA